MPAQRKLPLTGFLAGESPNQTWGAMLTDLNGHKAVGLLLPTKSCPPMSPFELIGRTEHIPKGAPHPPSRQPSSTERQCACRRVRGPGGRPQARPNKQRGCREVRDAASTSWLAIAYAGCQPPCHPPHGTKEHPPCAQSTPQRPLAGLSVEQENRRSFFLAHTSICTFVIA